MVEPLCGPVRRVNVDFTAEMLKESDPAVSQLNISRQAVIRTLLRQALDRHYLAEGGRQKAGPSIENRQSKIGSSIQSPITNDSITNTIDIASPRRYVDRQIVSGAWIPEQEAGHGEVGRRGHSGSGTRSRSRLPALLDALSTVLSLEENFRSPIQAFSRHGVFDPDNVVVNVR